MTFRPQRQTCVSAVMVGLLLALGGCFAGLAHAEGAGVVVAPVRFASELGPLGEGLVECVRERMRELEIPLHDPAEIRANLAIAADRPRTTEDVLAWARERRAPGALLLDVDVERAQATVLLRYYELATSRLVAAGRASGRSAEIVDLADQALTQMIDLLPTDYAELDAYPPITLDDLVAVVAFTRRMDRGDIPGAWSALAGRKAPRLDGLRLEVQQAVKGPGVQHAERVRLLVAMGEMDTAWAMIFARAEAQLGTPRAKPNVMLAAGETQLARGEIDQARAYLEQAVEIEPGSVDAWLALGRVRELSSDRPGARVAYLRALDIDPGHVDALERLARVAADDAERERTLARLLDLSRERLNRAGVEQQVTRLRKLDPSREGELLEVEAEVDARLGDFAAADLQLREAIRVAGRSAELLRARAVSLRALDKTGDAEAELTGALALDPNDTESLARLADIEIETGRIDSAIAHLERLLALRANSAEARRLLARALEKKGQVARAIELLIEAEALEAPSPKDLRMRASLQQQAGQLGSALEALERAVAADPTEDSLETLISLYRESGNPEAAVRYESFVLAFGGAHLKKMLGETQEAAEALSPSLDAAVESLLASEPRAKRVMLLPLRETAPGLHRYLDWVRPKIPDRSGMEDQLRAALARGAEPVATAPPTGYYAEMIDALLDFGSDAALDSKTGAMVNAVLGTDAVLLGRFSRNVTPDESTPPACGGEDYSLVELRLVTGQVTEDVSFLAKSACLAGGLGRHGAWNPVAFALYAGVALLLVFPFVRGSGTVTVNFVLPPKATPFFSVSITPRRKKLKDDQKEQADDKWRIREKLQALGKNEKRLEQGTTLEFTRIAARRRPYFITVRGPLLDSHTEDVVGSFNMEKEVVVRRGEKALVEFDMVPKQSIVEVRVLSSGAASADARVGLRGDPRSVRFTRGRPSFFYLDPGDYVIVAGAEGAVAEAPLHVPNLDPIKLSIDLWDDDQQVFSDCAAAVTPYIEGHFARAAEALTGKGLAEAAARALAVVALAQGDKTRARDLMVKAGAAQEAAAIQLDDDARPDGQAATLLESAGAFGEAARTYEETGDLEGAARAYEQSYDWDAAADCYRKLGRIEDVVRVLELAGDGFEAGRACCELEDWDRAITNLEQVDHRHPQYTETCVLIGELLAAKGDADLALERFEEARSRSSSTGLPVASYERYAQLLENAGRIDDALEAYREIRRRDRTYPGAKEKVEALQQALTQAPVGSTLETRIAGGTDMPTQVAGQSVAGASRYEVVCELGRGAMGVVYKARDTVLDRMVALKRLPESMREHELAVKFFLREARSAAALNHPNIVTIYDAGQENDQYFITMECLDGTALDAVLKKVGRFSPRDTALLGIQAATGLGYAHANRIIHRDIKPSNLFYTRDKVVKIMDFGLAKAVEEVRKQATVIAGTPYYMPPEQAVAGIVDQRSDLYSLGITFYQFCTGKVPFPEGDIAYHHRHTSPPDPREHVPDVPEALAALILKMIEKEPDARLQNAEDVAGSLRRIVDETARGA